eukprot:449519-Pyramimonas_sp.AAC.1
MLREGGTCPLFLPSWPVLSSPMRNAWREWDAARIPRGRRCGVLGYLPLALKCRAAPTCAI